METTTETSAGMRSDSIAALAKALAAAQSAFTPIERSREVKVSSEKGSYTFAYAPLDVVLAATTPALGRNGLSVTSQLLGGAVRTLLIHESGEWLAADVPLPRTDRPQQLGSAITYARRYSIVALLGVASEEDDDGNAAEGNHIISKANRPPKAPAAAVTSAEAVTAGRSALPPSEPMATPAEVKSLNTAITGVLRIKDRVEKLQWISGMAGREIASSKELTSAECVQLTKAANTGEMPPTMPPREPGSDDD